MTSAGRRRPFLLAMGVACAALAAAAAPAGADSVLVRNLDDSVTVTANEADAPVTITADTCGPFSFRGFQLGCDPSYTDFSSSDGFTESSPECAEEGSASVIRCGPAAPRVTVNATGGDDTIGVTGNFGNVPALTAFGLGGDDQIDGSPYVDDVEGGAGDDTISLLGGDDTAAGGSGDDLLSATGGDNDFEGGDGSDTLSTGDGQDALDGGPGRDVLDAGAGDDTLAGGDGRDDLRPGAGRDTVGGGPGTDLLNYADRVAGVTVVLGAAGNGEPGENDTVNADVEDVATGAGNDKVTGNGAFNRIETGAGNDTIDPKGDSDFVDAGSGDDLITARDGAIDRIECGAGNDRAVTDEFDVTSNCEVNETSRELMSDVDNDGVAAPVDCDDRNPSRRPGLPDKPGNGVDEDCDGRDAEFARILSAVTHRFTIRGARTLFTRMRVIDVPDKATVELRCRGGRKRGCRRSLLRRSTFAGGRERLDLRRQVRRLRLRRKARLDLLISRPDTIAKLVRFKVRGRKAPRVQVRCVRPGGKPARRC